MAIVGIYHPPSILTDAFDSRTDQMSASLLHSSTPDIKVTVAPPTSLTHRIPPLVDWSGLCKARPIPAVLLVDLKCLSAQF
jgi:hypothetical protein